MSAQNWTDLIGGLVVLMTALAGYLRAQSAHKKILNLQQQVVALKIKSRMPE